MANPTESDYTMDTSDQSTEDEINVNNAVKKLATNDGSIIGNVRKMCGKIAKNINIMAKNPQTEKVQSKNNGKNEKKIERYNFRNQQAAAEIAERKNTNDDDGAITNDVKYDVKKSKKSQPFEIDPNLNLFESSNEPPGSFNTYTIYNINPGMDFVAKSGTILRYIKPIGWGGSSLIWLAYDLQNKMFKAVKVLKYGRRIRDEEAKALPLFQNHQHIIQFYESFTRVAYRWNNFFTVYEPMGKDLQQLIHEASKNKEYFSMDVIKKVAKHILSALETIHKCEIDGKKIIHSDIKPRNIAVCTSQRNIFDQLEKIVESHESLLPLRMSWYRQISSPSKNAKLKEGKVWPRLNECLNSVPEAEELNGLTFKLMDFGNVLKEGERGTTGAYGFCPPEYYFGVPISYSHDIWSLGITLLHMLTCQHFIPYPPKDTQKKREMEKLIKMFGKFPRDVYSDCKFPWRYEKKFTDEGLNLEEFEIKFKKVLQKKIESYQMYGQMSVADRQELLSFLSNMIHFSPRRRKTAQQLLAHPWLKNII